MCVECGCGMDTVGTSTGIMGVEIKDMSNQNGPMGEMN